jgi:hypothetical protein
MEGVMRKTRWALLPLLLVILLSFAPAAYACGGFFCTNVPVDQAAERIIFAVNDGEGTIDAYVQINYQGAPDAFAWIVPVPNTPRLDVATMAMLRDLDRLTQPVFIAPPLDDTCRNRLPVLMSGAVPAPQSAPGGVTVFDQGSVGPFDYAVIGSEDPQALVNWLRENKYQITPAMEPFVDMYVKEKMQFLAMKLQPNKQVRDIQPVKMTYKSVKPMIPLRLTAVAATPNMVVLTWILSKAQAEPENYAAVKVPDSDIVFTGFGGNNYATLVSTRLNEYKGRAFITEFAGPAAQLKPNDPELRLLLARYPYLTRVYTRISPEEMTVDPVFKFNAALPDVSNVHDLSKDPGRVWECQANTISNRAANPVEATVIRATDSYNPIVMAIYGAGTCIALALGFVGVALVLARRSSR